MKPSRSKDAASTPTAAPKKRGRKRKETTVDTTTQRQAEPSPSPSPSPSSSSSSSSSSLPAPEPVAPSLSSPSLPALASPQRTQSQTRPLLHQTSPLFSPFMLSSMQDNGVPQQPTTPSEREAPPRIPIRQQASPSSSSRSSSESSLSSSSSADDPIPARSNRSPSAPKESQSNGDDGMERGDRGGQRSQKAELIVLQEFIQQHAELLQHLNRRRNLFVVFELQGPLTEPNRLKMTEEETERVRSLFARDRINQRNTIVTLILCTQTALQNCFGDWEQTLFLLGHADVTARDIEAQGVRLRWRSRCVFHISSALVELREFDDDDDFDLDLDDDLDLDEDDQERRGRRGRGRGRGRGGGGEADLFLFSRSPPAHLTLLPTDLGHRLCSLIEWKAENEAIDRRHHRSRSEKERDRERNPQPPPQKRHRRSSSLSHPEEADGDEESNNTSSSSSSSSSSK